MKREDSTSHYSDIIKIFSDPKGYRKWYEIHEIAYENEKRTVERLGLSDCLDIGSGPGIFHEVLRGNTISFDISEAMLKEVEGDRVVGEAHYLPFRDNSIPCVFVSVTICFLKDLETFMKEVWRVVKKDIGICIIARDSPWGELYESLGRQGHKYYSKANFISKEELIELVSKYFNIVETFSTLRYRPFEEDKLEEPIEGLDGSFICIRGKKG